MNYNFDLWKRVINKENTETIEKDSNNQHIESQSTKIGIISIICIICIIIGTIFWHIYESKTENPVCDEMYKILKSDEKIYDYKLRINYVNDFYKKGYNTQCKKLELLDKAYFLARIHTDWSDYIYKTDDLTEADCHSQKAGEYFRTSIAKFDFSKNSNKTTDSEYWDYFLFNISKIDKNFEENINKINFYYDHYHNKKCKLFAHLDRNWFLSELYENWAKNEYNNNLNRAIELQQQSITSLETSTANYFKDDYGGVTHKNKSRWLILGPKYFKLCKYYQQNKQHEKALINLEKSIKMLSMGGGDTSWFESNKCGIYWAMNDEENARISCEYAYKTLPVLIKNIGTDRDFVQEYNIVSSVYRQLINKIDCSYASKLGYEAKRQGDYSRAYQHFIEARNCVNKKCESIRTSYGYMGDVIVNSCKMENDIQFIELELKTLQDLWYYSH